MNGNKRGKRGTGSGHGFGGQGRCNGTGQRKNQRAGGQASGMGSTTEQGFCVCPQCGNRIRHHIGVPCVQQQCDLCGALMSRS